MGNALYLECASGISGDMAAAALLDLGADARVLEKALQSLPVKGFQVRISRVAKSGLDVCDFAVLLEEPHEDHGRGMEYLYGGQDCQEHHALRHSHERRGLAEILEVIEFAEMSSGAKGLAEKIFRILARAEAKAHGVSIEQVDLHETGAVDSLVDVVSAAVCLDNLDVTEVIVPKLCEGTGTVRSRHGILPVPVPAVLNIVQEYGLSLEITQAEGELVTPTGAAIAAAIRTADRLPRKFTVEKTGLGAGKRAYACPGFLRAMLLKPEKKEPGADRVCKLEANIDDCTGEILGYAMERLFEAGARDVHYIPVFMKKNRPAYQLNVICSQQDVPKMEEIIFRETTTIGIRKMQVERSVLSRKVQAVDTPLGQAAVKICTGSSGRWIYPEYESIAELARRHRMPYEQVNRLVLEDARKKFGVG